MPSPGSFCHRAVDPEQMSRGAGVAADEWVVEAVAADPDGPLDPLGPLGDEPHPAQTASATEAARVATEMRRTPCPTRSSLMAQR